MPIPAKSCTSCCYSDKLNQSSIKLDAYHHDLMHFGTFSAVGQTMAPKDAHILILRTCDYVNFHSNRDLADMLMTTNVGFSRSWKR